MPGQTWQIAAPFPPCLIPNWRPIRDVTNATTRPLVHPARLRIFHIDRLLSTMSCDVNDARSDPAKRHFGADRRGGVLEDRERGSGGCEPWLRPNRATRGKESGMMT